MKTFEIKSYGYSELAVRYLPTINKKSASNQFRKWIKLNHKLYDELKSYGFIPNQKILTPRQVSIIIQYLGEP